VENFIGGVPEVGEGETVRYIDYDYRAVVAVADKVCNKGGQSGGW
jgi:hypothetical protein